MPFESPVRKEHASGFCEASITVEPRNRISTGPEITPFEAATCMEYERG